MSDLEQAAMRSPIVTSAVGKLRSISGNAREFVETDGLADAFAQVFAQMAIATTPPVQHSEQAADASEDADQRVQQSAESNDREQQDDSESSDASGAEVVLSNQPLVGDPQDDTSLIGEPEASQKEAVVEASAESSNENSEHQTAPEVVVADIDAPTDDGSVNQVESVRVSDDAPVVADIDGKTNRPDRRDKTSQQGEEATQSPIQKTELETKSKTDEIRTDQTQQDDGNDQSSGREQQSSEPAERTARQKFLDQRRSEHRDDGEASKQTADSRVQKQTEASAESQTVTEALQTAAPPKAAAAPRVGAVAQSIVDAAGGSNKVAAKTPVSPIGGRGEGKSGNHPVQHEPGNRIDRGTDRETRPVKSDASSMAARVKLVQRVSRAFQHLGPDGGMIRLRLAPAELGSVRVEMQINQRKVQARVVAETEAASNALREHLPDLRARLESYGMQIERLDVETESQDQPNGSPFDQQPQQREPGQRQPRRETVLDRQQIKDEPSDLRQLEPVVSRQPALVSQGVDLRV